VWATSTRLVVVDILCFLQWVVWDVKSENVFGSLEIKYSINHSESKAKWKITIFPLNFTCWK
jgi:hypothetical protein